MQNEDIIIIVAKPDDAADILKVYTPYVENTAITFEYDVPSVEEFRARITKTLKKYPYIVAKKCGEIIGYAYTGAFVGRAAYDWAVETTIYINAGSTKCGLGKKLYTVLEKISSAQNILNMNACIGYPQIDDEHLTKNSVQFHAHLGYNIVGTFHKCGYKFGTWYDMVWMEKIIGEHSALPEQVIPFPKLSAETLSLCGLK